MKRNMLKWLEDLKNSHVKKAMPILSFPAIQLMGMSVKQIISDADSQAKGMKLVAEKTDAAASVSLMDLSVEAECFGSQIHISDDEVPTVTGRLITDADEADALKIPEVGTARTGIYINAIEKAVNLISDRPVFAGVIGPFSLAARLIDVTEIMMECYDDPDMVHTVLEKVTEFLINYCKAYKDAGANGIVMAEPVAGMLSPTLEEEFSSPYVKKIVDSVQDENFILIYHNCGDNTLAMTESIKSTGAAAYHFGNSINMAEMMTKFSENTVVMGNVDPAGEFFGGTPESVKKATFDVMEACTKHPNFVISSGCDIPPMSPWENINAFFDAVKEFYADEHK